MENNNFNTISHQAQKKQTSPVLDFLLLSLFCVLACLYIPTALFIDLGTWLSAALALGVCIFAAVALCRMSGSFKPIAGYAVIVGFFAFFGGAFLLTALLVCFVSSAVVYAYLIKSKFSQAVWGLPLIPALLALLITQNALGVCLSLISLPPSLMLALSVKSKCSRVGAVCRISSGICLSALAVLALAVYMLRGAVSAEIIKELVGYAKEQMSLFVSGMLGDLQAMLGDMAVSIDTDGLVTLMVSSVFNLLPAVLITFANIAAYIIHSLYLASQYSMTRKAREEAKEMLTFDMSVISAAIYIASLILSLALVSPETAMYGTVAQNLVLILVPGLVITALAFVRALSVAKGPSCFGTLLYFGLIFLIAGLNPIILMCVALVGAVLIIISHIAQRRSARRKE